MHYSSIASSTVPALTLNRSCVRGGNKTSAWAEHTLSRRLLIWLPVISAVGRWSPDFQDRITLWYSGRGSSVFISCPNYMFKKIKHLNMWWYTPPCKIESNTLSTMKNPVELTNHNNMVNFFCDIEWNFALSKLQNIMINDYKWFTCLAVWKLSLQSQSYSSLEGRSLFNGQ